MDLNYIHQTSCHGLLYLMNNTNWNFFSAEISVLAKKWFRHIPSKFQLEIFQCVPSNGIFSWVKICIWNAHRLAYVEEEKMDKFIMRKWDCGKFIDVFCISFDRVLNFLRQLWNNLHRKLQIQLFRILTKYKKLSIFITLSILFCLWLYLKLRSHVSLFVNTLKLVLELNSYNGLINLL